MRPSYSGEVQKIIRYFHIWEWKRLKKRHRHYTLKMIKKKKNWTLHNAMGAFSQKMTIMTWYFFVLNSFERFFKKIRKKKSIHQMIWTLQKFTIYVLTKSLCTYVISYRTWIKVLSIRTILIGSQNLTVINYLR